MKSAIAALAAVAMLGAGMVAVGVDTARADTFDFTVEAVGANEVPAVTGTATATGEFTFDDETNELEYVVTVDGLTEAEVTAAHIHRGEEGENGPVAYALSTVGFTEIEGTVELSDDDVEALIDGELYLNVHSVANPDGFARVQLELPEEATEADPTSTTTASATTTPSATATTAPLATATVGATSEVASQVSPPSTGSGGLLANDNGQRGVLPLVLLLSAVALGSTTLVAMRRHR